MRRRQLSLSLFSTFFNIGLLLVGLIRTAAGGLGVEPFESIGPSSRKTGLVFTEILHHPEASAGGHDFQFIELYNSDLIPEDLSGYRLEGSVQYLFPNGIILGSGSYLVIGRDPSAIVSKYGATNVIGPFTGSLHSRAGVVRLENRFGARLLEVRFETALPWPVAAGGAGHSMVLAHPSHGEGDPRAWEQSGRIGGSPGTGESPLPNPWDGIVINEFLIATEPAHDGFIEIYNHTNEAKDLSGAWLTKSGSKGFRIPDEIAIAAQDYRTFKTSVLGFDLNSAGGEILLLNPDRSSAIDAITYEVQEPGVPTGRFPNGSAEFYRLSESTPGSGNATPVQSPVVINEIMYHSISGSDHDQFVELYNRSASAVDLGNWKFVSGVSFTFPPQTIIPGHGFIVIAKDAKRLRSHYLELNKHNCVGNFGGSLSRNGERLALARPIEKSPRQPGNTIASTQYAVVNEVTYRSGGQWGQWSDGGGSSLELVDPDSNTRLADNWRDSDESAKSGWTTIEFRGPVSAALGHPAGNTLHVYLLGEGECLLDEVEVIGRENVNLISNPGFEFGLSDWIPQGALDQSTIEPIGFTGNRSLHIRAGSRGDPGANKIRSAEFPALSENEPVTIRCKARWLKGWPELLLRLQGGGAEAFGRLSVPFNLGTPGKANSRHRSLAGPAFSEIRHTPVLPANNQPVVVTARVYDSNGLKNIVLRYRIDPSMTFAELEMNDLGERGDAVAHDGIFSATIPGQPAGKLVAFHIAATNRFDAGNTFPKEVFPDHNSQRFFPGDSLSHECLIRFGEPLIGGRVPTYRLWLTEANRDRWIRRDRLNNADLDVTFVYNDERVVYGAGAQTAGSPWHTDQMATGPDGTNRFDYVVHLPKDSPILGETDFNLVIPGNGDGAGSSDLSALSEPVSLLLFRDMGLPYLHRRFIHFFVNGTERSSVAGLPGHFVYEDVQQPNRKSIHEWFPGDSHGQLFKIEDWFEFTNSVATGFENKDADLVRRTLPGTTNLNAAPYRFMFRLRGLQAGESGNDYKDFFHLIDAVSPNAAPDAPIEFEKVNKWVDLDEWFRVFACQRTLGNWDSYGWERGKNCYLYRPGKGKFVLIPWDVDATLALGGREPASDLFGSNDPRIAAMLKLPAIKRMYLRSFQEILNGPLRPGNLESAFDVRAEALLSNGVSYDPSLTVANKAYLAARRAYIAEQLSRYKVPFSVATPSRNLREQTRLRLQGKAPLQVAGIRINSEPAEVTWSTPTDWALTVSLHPGTNVFAVEGIDRKGSTHMGLADRVSLVVEEK